MSVYKDNSTLLSTASIASGAGVERSTKVGFNPSQSGNRHCGVLGGRRGIAESAGEIVHAGGFSLASAQPQELIGHHMPDWRQSQKQLGLAGHRERLATFFWLVGVIIFEVTQTAVREALRPKSFDATQLRLISDPQKSPHWTLYPAINTFAAISSLRILIGHTSGWRVLAGKNRG